MTNVCVGCERDVEVWFYICIKCSVLSSYKRDICFYRGVAKVLQE